LTDQAQFNSPETLVWSKKEEFNPESVISIPLPPWPRFIKTLRTIHFIMAMHTPIWAEKLFVGELHTRATVTASFAPTRGMLSITDVRYIIGLSSVLVVRTASPSEIYTTDIQRQKNIRKIVQSNPTT
jgi:hypothetical protein